MATQQIDGSDLTQGSLLVHMHRLAVPASVGLFFNVLFNVTDTFCASLWSTDALTAISFTFPLFFVSLSIGVGLLQGTTGLLARSSGAGKVHEARYYFGQSYILVLIFGMIVGVVGLLLARDMLSALGAKPVHVEMGFSYIVWIYAFAPLMIGSLVLSGVLTAYGNTKTFRNALITTSIINVVLDPLLMFGWFGLPKLGMHGIGIATVISFAIQIAIMLPVARRLPPLAGWRALYLRPRKIGMLRCLQQSWPATANMLSINLGFVINTYYLANINTLAVAAYGVALRIEQLVLLPAHGINIALLSIAGQNFGARNYDRLHYVFYLAIKIGLAVMFIGAVFELGFGQFLIGLFDDSAQVVVFGYEYLIVAVLIAPTYVLAHNANSMLQAVGQPRMISFFAGMRLGVLPLLFCWLFITVLGYGTLGVWVSLLISNYFVATMLYLYSRKTVQRLAPLPAVAVAT